MLDRDPAIGEEANFRFDLICVPWVFSQDQQRTFLASRKLLRQFSRRQGAARTDQASPGHVVASLRKLQIIRNKFGFGHCGVWSISVCGTRLLHRHKKARVVSDPGLAISAFLAFHHSVDHPVVFKKDDKVRIVPS